MTEKSRPYIIGGAREAFPRPNQSGSKMKSKVRFVILGVVCLLATYVYYGLNRTSVDLEVNSAEISEQVQRDNSVTSDSLGDYNYDDENEDYDDDSEDYDEDYDYEDTTEEAYTYYTDDEEKDDLVKEIIGENKEDAGTQVDIPVAAGSENVDVGWSDSEEDAEDTQESEPPSDEKELIIDDAANTVGGEDDSPSIEELEQSFRQAELLETMAQNEDGSGMLPDDEDYNNDEETESYSDDDDSSRDYADEIDEAQPTVPVALNTHTTETNAIQLQPDEAQIQENGDEEEENEDYEFEIEDDDEVDDVESGLPAPDYVDVELSGDIESGDSTSVWVELSGEEEDNLEVAETVDDTPDLAVIVEKPDIEKDVAEVDMQVPELENEDSDGLVIDGSGQDIVDDIPPVRLMSDEVSSTDVNNNGVNHTLKLPSFPPSGLQFSQVVKENNDMNVEVNVVNSIPSTQSPVVQEIQMHEPIVQAPQLAANTVVREPTVQAPQLVANTVVHEPTVQAPQLVANTDASSPEAPQSHHLSFYKYHYQFTNPNKKVSYGTPLYLKSTVADKLQDAESLKLAPVYEEFVFVVATQSHQYTQTLEVIASIQKFFPRHFTFLYDLGLQPIQADHSKTLCNVIYKKYDYKAYPQTIAETIVDRQVHLSMIIHDAFITSPGVLFLDNTMRVRSSNLSTAFSTAHANGGIAFFDSDSDVTFGDLDLLNFFPSSSMLLSMPQIKPTAFLIYNTKVMLNNILWWWYACSLDSRCMTTYSLTSCFTWKEQGLSYADCRLLDKSLLTVLSANYFDFNPKWYAVNADTISKWAAAENIAWRVNVCPLKA